MGLAAEAALKIRQPGQTALQLLDLICEPHRGCDAEFEAEDPNKRGHLHPDYTFYTDPVAALGSLIVEAFAPTRDWAAEWRAWRSDPRFGDDSIAIVRDMWEDTCAHPGCPMHQFSKRYEFD